MEAKILILDDDRDIQELVAFKLENASFKTIQVYTVEEAINMLTAEKFDCVLIDIVLSDNRSSNELIEFLKGSFNHLNKHIPLLVMSVHMTDEYANAICAKEPMILNTIKKPFSKDLDIEMLIEDTILAAIFLKEDRQKQA